MSSLTIIVLSQSNRRLTKRAPDAGDSGAIYKQFPGFEFFSTTKQSPRPPQRRAARTQTVGRYFPNNPSHNVKRNIASENQ